MQLKNIPISIEDIKILINLFIKTKLKLNNFFVFRKINNKMALNQDDIVVAIGIIINPTSLKNIMLMNMFSRTDIREI